MRRLVAIIISLGVFSASALLYAEAVKAPNAPPAGKSSSARVTKVRVAGVVTEISDTSLKIERKVRDQVETMDFVLEKPVPKIKAGDKVRVSYVIKEDKNIATRVDEDIPQKIIKKMPKKDVKPAPGGGPPIGK